MPYGFATAGYASPVPRQPVLNRSGDTSAKGNALNYAQNQEGVLASTQQYTDTFGSLAPGAVRESYAKLSGFDPYQGSADQATALSRPILANLTDTLQKVGGTANAAGRYGGGRMQYAMGRAGADSEQQVADAIARMSTERAGLALNQRTAQMGAASTLADRWMQGLEGQSQQLGSLADFYSNFWRTQLNQPSLLDRGLQIANTVSNFLPGSRGSR